MYFPFQHPKKLGAFFVCISEAPKQWEGTISKQWRSFHWFSLNSELEATWINLIGWPHKASILEHAYAVIKHAYAVLEHFYANLEQGYVTNRDFMMQKHVFLIATKQIEKCAILGKVLNTV